MRRVIAVLAALLLTAGIVVVLWMLGLVLGGTECDRGQCNWLGEAYVDAPIVFFAAFLAVGGFAGMQLGRRIARGGD